MRKEILAQILAGISVIFLAFAGFRLVAAERETVAVINALEDTVASLQKELGRTRQDNAGLEQALEEERRKGSDLAGNLQAEQQKSENLIHGLVVEQDKNKSYESQVQQMTQTVDTLKKLSETDQELLRKYSKIYFLNENYIPANLSYINTSYLYNPARTLQIHAKAAPFLSKMMDAAARDGLTLKILSAYRSFGEQSSLKTGYRMIYGYGANQFSADQGYSEHQLGTTVDITTPEIKESFGGFDRSAAYRWLQKNAYLYGFILSYPPNNSYYQFEPWHWRFVGTALAARLHNENKFFYDLSQREINNYLVNIFD